MFCTFLKLKNVGLNLKKLSFIYFMCNHSAGELITGKVKVKVSLEQATKAQRGNRCIALLCLKPRR